MLSQIKIMIGQKRLILVILSKNYIELLCNVTTALLVVVIVLDLVVSRSVMKFLF